MNADLAKTIEELGPSYGALVGELRAMPEVDPSGTRRFVAPDSRRLWWTRLPRLAAASLALAMALAALLRWTGGAPEGAAPAPSSTPYTLAFSLPSGGALDEMVRTQNADGSWANDFLTRQNAAALRGIGGARLAYRRAVRYLRMKGLSPMSDAEFAAMRERLRS